MAEIKFTLNGKSQSVNVSPRMPLLWVLRDTLNMTGTKFGCGIAQCGACTVHLNGQAIRSCITPVSNVASKSVTTIEGAFNGQFSIRCKAPGLSWTSHSAVIVNRARSWRPLRYSLRRPNRPMPISTR